MSDRDWTSTRRKLPPEGVVVETMQDGGDGVVTLLTRRGTQYFLDDGMYVYYVPLIWREL